MPKWLVPRATTSGDHLQRAHPALSVLIPFPHVHFLIFQMEEMCSGSTGSDLCPNFVWYVFAEEEQEEGVNKGRRDRSSRIILFYDYSCP